jgi:phage terminase small subunit
MANKLNDKQRKAIQGIAAGMTHDEAAIHAGYSGKRSVQKMMSYDVTKRYLAELRAKSEKKAEKRIDGHILTKEERKAWLTRAITTPIGEIDSTSDLCIEDTQRENQQIFKKVNPLAALTELNKMDGGHTPQEVNMNFAEKFFTGLDSKQGLHNDTK